MNTKQHKHDGVRDYSLETLAGISKDLSRNPLSKREGTWEHGRLKAVKAEIKNRVNRLLNK